MVKDKLHKAAELLIDAQNRCDRISLLPSSLRPVDLIEGYRIQDIVTAGSDIVGWKIAATSRAGQIHIGIDHPIAGQLASSCILHSGDTAVMTGNLMLAAEAEFVFEFSADLPARDARYEIDEVMLREELHNLRGQLSEGEAKAMAHHFGGGKAGKDALDLKDTDINVLKEMRKLMQDLSNSGRQNRALQSKLNEYRSAVKTLREQLTDLNLFNSKLLYVNKLLQNPNVSAPQRKSIIESLDNARSLREVKLLYKSLMESFSKDKSKNLSESTVRRTLGSSSRATRRASAQTSEAAEVNRWAELAGLK